VGLINIEKKVIVTTAVSLGLVATISFAATSSTPDSLNLATLNNIDQSAPMSALMDNSRADNRQATDSETVLVSSANTSNSSLATVVKPAKNVPPANKQSNSKSIPKEIPQSWLEQVQKDIAQREYHITWQDKTDLPNNQAAWQAPNRAHDFRTYFTGNGLTVVPRSGIKDWLWSLKLIAYGDEQTNSQTKPEVKDNRIEYSHSAKLKEWYINNAQGLEQGFTLNAPANNQNTIKLSFQLGGSLIATLTNNNQTISLKDKNQQQRFTFGKLKVIDANNTTLKSHFELNKQTQILTLVTDASGAVYPITVDPVLSGASSVLEENQVDAQFGYSVASAGDINGDGFDDVIIGVPNYSNGVINGGAVFVYLGSSTGLSVTFGWSAMGNQASAQFGFSVASAGNVNGGVNVATGLPIDDVIIGAPFYNNNGLGNKGAAFVYLGSNIGLATNPAWNVGGNINSASFGISVASAGDVNGDGFGDVIIGVPNYSNGQTNEGATFVYLGSSSGLNPIESWVVEGNQSNARFGKIVASAGDINGDGYEDVIVGAPFYSNGNTFEGAAFVYLGSSTGLNNSADWISEGNQNLVYFGEVVASAGNVNGDSFDDVIITSRTNQGTAFVYLGSASGLNANAMWSAKGSLDSKLFGSSVAGAGDINGDGFGDIIVGASGHGDNYNNEGAVFVYLGSTAGLSVEPVWFAEGNQSGASLGFSVAGAGDINGDGFSDLIVGAYKYDNGQNNEGVAFVYMGSSTGINPAPIWRVESNKIGAQFGYSVASAGDVNGDGYGDVIIGAPNYDNGLIDEGAAFVYLGSMGGLDLSQIPWRDEGGFTDEFFGSSVASAGDINGDGYGDVIVGAYKYDSSINGNVFTNAGGAFVYYGSSAGLNMGQPSIDWAAQGNQNSERFGSSVASAGDVNGDGFGDVIIGAGGYSNGESGEGAAFVYFGSSMGLNTNADWYIESNQADASFGDSVAGAGDVNGDGFGDVIIGAHRYSNGLNGEGAAFIYLGSPLGLADTASWSTVSNEKRARFGSSVASAGDINGDGYGDVIVGAHYYITGLKEKAGAAFVYLGSGTGLEPVHSWLAEGNQEFVFFGRSVASAGDVNNDGFGDVIIGSTLLSNSGAGESAAYVYLGTGSGLTTTPGVGTGPNPAADWKIGRNQTDVQTANSVASTGDINGDGYDDIIIGAPYQNNIGIFEGAAAIYDLTPPLAPFTPSGSYNITQHLVSPRLSNGSTLIPACGLSDRRDSFKLQVNRNNAAPNATLQLEWEVKANGDAFVFGGLPNKGSMVQADSVGRATITEIVSGMKQDTAYRWRARVLENGVAGPWLRVLNHDVQGCDVRTNTESDLALSITGPAAVADQHDFEVVFTIDNNVAPDFGPDRAQAVKLVISNIPSAYSYKTFSSNNAGVSCVSPQTPAGAVFRTDTCTVTNINPGTATTITVTYTATTQVNGSLTGAVSLKNSDPNLANNTAFYNITVTPRVGVTIDRTDFVTDENKLMVSRSVVLNGPPDGVVTISVASGNTSEGSATPSKVTFNAEDWNIPKPVSVHGMPEDMMNIDSGFTNYIVFLTPISTVQLDNTQIKLTTVLINGAIELSGTNNSTNTGLQADVLAIPHAVSPGYDAKNIPKGNVSLRWNKVISPGGLPVNYTVKICKDDVTLNNVNNGCLALPVLTSANTGFSPMLYASFGGSSLLFLGLMNTRIRRRWVLVLVTVAVASTLVACSGSGGSDLPPSAPPEADTMGTTVSLVAGTWYWQVVASDGGTPVASEVMIFTVQ